jgi:hypothetical protein
LKLAGTDLQDPLYILTAKKAGHSSTLRRLVSQSDSGCEHGALFNSRFVLLHVPFGSAAMEPLRPGLPLPHAQAEQNAMGFYLLFTEVL